MRPGPGSEIAEFGMDTAHKFEMVKRLYAEKHPGDGPARAGFIVHIADGAANVVGVDRTLQHRKIGPGNPYQVVVYRFNSGVHGNL